jgi:fructose-1-phosphate kinase PfkB-like protein
LPPGIPGDFYARVGALALANHVPFVLDTSGPALGAAGTNVFLTSLRELEQLTGTAIQNEREEEIAA